MATKFTTDDVTHIASLANIPVTDGEKKSLADGFTKTIGVVEELNKLDVSVVTAVHMTGLSNVLREDEVDKKRMFTQEQALANAPNTHNGYFVVDQLIEQDD
ncbi:MAG TPA: Asp-tRNA(Asn)/Glu-tRNA(Gln) amidotransferase subunit GatC [Patescibacteria group bacterium]|nr:Asp-tRNA(Asn)/Glu-tRNA(Gln) amidotransferase subunit GatC [Patescibacteria group bacterium]